MNDPLNYQGTRAVVTGASSGIGQAPARLLVDLDVEVNTIDIKPTRVPVADRLIIDLQDKSAIEKAPEEQAWPVLMLSSSRFSYLTGQSFLIDGGLFTAIDTGQPPE
jgi:NAD(P)-dependent dehydrogenase (short-subunit alcohol dehydrogenase family)